MDKNLVWCAKIGISVAILGFLSYRAWQDRSFDELLSQPKHWGLLACALLASMASVLVGFLRWYLLVRALGLPFTMRDAIRLGCIGLFFSFLALGAVGGDVLKAVFIAREQHGRRLEAVASVIVDRIIGFYSLFLVATFAILFSDFSQPQIRRVGQATIGLTILGTVALTLLLLPGFTENKFLKKLTTIPKLGAMIERANAALRTYRAKPTVLAVALLLSVVMNAVSIFGVYFVSRGLPGESPSLETHVVIVPIALVANVVPLPGGLGAFEAALDYLYRSVAQAGSTPGRGFVIALVMRLIAMVFALVGASCYVVGRRTVTPA